MYICVHARLPLSSYSIHIHIHSVKLQKKQRENLKQIKKNEAISNVWNENNTEYIGVFFSSFFFKKEDQV